ncbi:MAG: hypothetical protein ACKVJE_07310 [Pseudomonadales bacterium]|jgi:hypothetical protein
MKMFTQTIALTSILFAASAIASTQGLAPPMHSTESNMQSPSTIMADDHYVFTGIYDSALSSSSTERHLGQGITGGTLQASEFCLTTGLFAALNENSVENHLGGKQC